MESVMIGSIGTPELFVSLVWILIYLIPVFLIWRIFRKAGYHGAYGLLLFVPVINYIALAFFAFSEWPIEKRIKEIQDN